MLPAVSRGGPCPLSIEEVKGTVDPGKAILGANDTVGSHLATQGLGALPQPSPWHYSLRGRGPSCIPGIRIYRT
jgi:hypothetical protein